jgi:hypothetical protein
LIPNDAVNLFGGDRGHRHAATYVD